VHGIGRREQWRQWETYGVAPQPLVRFEQRQEQAVSITPYRDQLTVIVANNFACANERLRYPFQGAASGLLLK
jgi:hypothetical protein